MSDRGVEPQPGQPGPEALGGLQQPPAGFRRFGQGKLSVGMSPIARTLMQLAQAPAQGFDLVLVGILLPLGQLQELKDFVHILERVAEGSDDARHLIDGLLDAGRRGGLSFVRGTGGHFPFERCRLDGPFEGFGSFLGGRGLVQRFLHRRRRFRRAGRRRRLQLRLRTAAATSSTAA